MKKETKTQKIIKGLSMYPELMPKELAKKLKVKPNLVHQVMWQRRKDKAAKKAAKKPSKIITATRITKAELDALLPKPDLVNKPPHYTAGGVDFLDYAEAKGLTENAYLFNVVKYVSRAGKKVDADPVQDLQKAEFYLKREIERRKSA